MGVCGTKDESGGNLAKEAFHESWGAAITIRVLGPGIDTQVTAYAKEPVAALLERLSREHDLGDWEHAQQWLDLEFSDVLIPHDSLLHDQGIREVM